MKVKRMVKTDVSTFKVGDIIKVKLTDGEKAQAVAVKKGKGGMIFCFVDCLVKEYPMNETNTNEGGYGASELRKKLNGEILDRFPADLKARMISFDNGDLLRIPTEKEIHGGNFYGERESRLVTQWKPMKLCRNRIALGGENGNLQWYWVQNKVCNSVSSFALVSSYGDPDGSYATDSRGVRPAFCIS